MRARREREGDIGYAMARRFTTSRAACSSLRSAFMNLSRAGVAKKRSRTSTRVPGGWAAGCGRPLRPASTLRLQASLPPRTRLVSVSRLTAAIEGSASPRKPKLRMRVRSSCGNLEVAWRSSAKASSSAVMPQPSSVTWMSVRPPSRTSASTRVAPASSAFSMSSLSAAAGRSTTSPAAIWLTRFWGRRRMLIAGPARRDRPARGACRPRPPVGRRDRRRGDRRR